MNTEVRNLLLIAVLVFACSAATSWAQHNTGRSVDNPTAAFERVLLYTGLDRQVLLPEGQRLDERAEKVVMRDTSVAFAREFVDNRRVWHFAGSEIQLPDSEGITTEHWAKQLRTMEFWVDSLTGSLLLVRSVRDDNDEPSTEPPWSEVFRPLPELKETYWGFPDVEPVVTLREALNECHSAPWMARTWSATCVLYSQGEEKPKPTWIIYFSGMPDMEPNPIAPITHQRNAVEASNGEVLMYFRYAINMSASPDAQNGD